MLTIEPVAPRRSQSTAPRKTEVDTTAPEVSSATAAADGTTLTMQIPKNNLKASLFASDWSYPVGGVYQGSPTSGGRTAGEVRSLARSRCGSPRARLSR